MEVILTTTFNVAALAHDGGLRPTAHISHTAAASASPNLAPTHTSSSHVRPCSVRNETVEGFRRGGVVARFLWNETNLLPEGWWTPSASEAGDHGAPSSVSSREASPHKPLDPRRATLEFVIGRDSHTCDVVVPLRLDHGPLFSRRHCALRVGLVPPSPATKAHFGTCEMSVVDLDSRNGTFVDGRRVAPCSAASLGDDDGSGDSPTASAAVVTAPSFASVRFHPCLDADVATGVTPLLTLAFGAGASVPTGAELPDDALRLRFHVYIRVLWRSASWELGRWLSRPHPRLGSARTQMADAAEDQAHTANPLRRANGTSPETVLTMHDHRGDSHQLCWAQHEADDAREGSGGGDGPARDSATQGDWLEDIHRTFDGSLMARAAAPDTATPPSSSRDAALRLDAGLQWLVLQLGGARALSDHTVAQLSLDTSDALPSSLPLLSVAKKKSLSTLPTRGEHTGPDGAALTTQINPATARTAPPTAVSTSGNGGRPSAPVGGVSHDATRAIVAQHAAIRTNGLTRHTCASQPLLPPAARPDRAQAPSPSLSPSRSHSTVLPPPHARFSHVLAPTESEVETEQRAPASAPRHHDALWHDDMDAEAPVLVRSRRASDHRGVPLAHRTAEPNIVVELPSARMSSRESIQRLPPTAASPSPSQSRADVAEHVRLVHSTERLSSHPPSRRRVSLSAWPSPTSPRTRGQSTEANASADIVAEPFTGSDEDIIEVLVTPPPEAAVVDEEGPIVTARDVTLANTTTEACTTDVTASAKSGEKRLSRKQRKVAHASETIRRFMQELQREDSEEREVRNEATSRTGGEAVSALFHDPSSPSRASASARRHSHEANDAPDVLSQIQREVLAEEGLHAHITRRLSADRSRAHRGSSPSSPARVAKALAATLRSGLALGRTTLVDTSVGKAAEGENNDAEDDLALADLLSLSPARPTVQITRPSSEAPAVVGSLSHHAAKIVGHIDGEEDCGRRTASTTHLSPRVSFDGARYRATRLATFADVSAPAPNSEAAAPAETWQVFIATQAPSLSPRSSKTLASARSSAGELLAREDGWRQSHHRDEDAGEVSAVHRHTLQGALGQHVRDQHGGTGGDDDEVGPSQYTQERAWILTGAHDADGEPTPEGSPRSGALFRFPHASPPSSSRSSRVEARRSEPVSSAPWPPLSQLMSLDVEAYLRPSSQRARRDPEVASARKAVTSPRGKAKAAACHRTGAGPEADPAPPTLPPLLTATIPLLEPPRLHAPRPAGHTARPTAVRDRATVLEKTDDGDLAAGLPAVVSRCLYPHQRAALRFLWRVLLSPLPSEPAALSSVLTASAAAARARSSRLVLTEGRESGVPSSARKRATYRPLITVSDIADILEAHYPPRPGPPPMTDAATAALTASQVFDQRLVDQRASQLAATARVGQKRDREVDDTTAAIGAVATACEVDPVEADHGATRGAVLAHAAGLGKTVTAIAFFMQLWTVLADDANSPARCALPMVFRARADGGRGGVRTVLCVPKQSLSQWTRSLDMWLTLAGHDTHTVFVLHQELRRHARAREAVLREWAATSSRGPALLIVTHTLLTAMLCPPRQKNASPPPPAREVVGDTEDGCQPPPKGRRRASSLRKSSRARSAKSCQRRQSHTATASEQSLLPRPTDLPPPQESFWVDEVGDGEESAVTDADSADSADDSTPVERHAHAEVAETLLGGDDVESTLDVSEPPPRATPAVTSAGDNPRAVEDSDDALAACERECRRILLNSTTLLVVDEADKLTDMSSASSRKASAAPSLSLALACFPSGTARVALTGRLPSLLSHSHQGPARSALTGLLRFVRPDVSATVSSSTRLLSMYRHHQSYPHTTVSQRLPAIPCSADNLGTSPQTKEDESTTEWLNRFCEGSASPRLSSLTRPSMAQYVLPTARHSGCPAKAAFGQTLNLQPQSVDGAVFAINECTPDALHPGALPELIETTLVFDLSPVQAVLLRELVRDLATTPHATPRASEAEEDAAPAMQDSKRTKTAQRTPSKAAHRGHEEKSRNAPLSSEVAASDSTTHVLPPSFHLAFTTYALYISNQCDLVRDWCQRQGIDANTSVQEVEAHEARCAAFPTRRARWAIPSLLTPSVFDTEERHTDLSSPASLRASPTGARTVPVCMDALEYSWKMRGLFFLLGVALTRREKVLVFSHSLKTLVLIAWLLDHGNNLLDGIDFALISGTLSAAQRDRLFTTFNDPAAPLSVLLLTFEMARTGIDLHMADRVVLFDTSRVVGTEVQAVTRAVRLAGPAGAPGAPQRRTVYVNRLLSNEPVEVESIPMTTLRALALRVVSTAALNQARGCDDVVVPTTAQRTRPPMSTRTSAACGVKCECPLSAEDSKGGVGGASVVASPLRCFVEDVARLDVKTGFGTHFASALAFRAYGVDDPAADLARDAGTLGREPRPESGRGTAEPSLASPRARASRGTTVRTLQRALAGSSGFVSLTGAPQATVSPPMPRPSARRRGRSATPPPPPLPSRCTIGAGAGGLSAGELADAYFARVYATGLSGTTMASLPSRTSCESGDASTARYFVPAVLAYLRLAEERRRQRRHIMDHTAAAAACPSPCDDPVVAELASMPAVRDILATHFHENRVWNALNTGAP